MTTLTCENVTYQYEKGSKVLEHITTQFERSEERRVGKECRL